MKLIHVKSGKSKVIGLELTVGRNYVSWLSPTTSREHFRIFKHKTAWMGWLIEDLKSTNGTFVNGEKLDPEKPVAIGIGDVIKAGGDTFTVCKSKGDVF